MDSSSVVPFGKPMRALFPFAPTYCNTNHGSYGTFPSDVAATRLQHLADHEARAEIHKRLASPALLRDARAALLPLLGPDVDIDEVVLVPNTTTGVNAVLRNLAAEWSAPGPDAGDAVLFFTPIFDSCGNTLQYLSQKGRLHPVEIRVAFPEDDDDSIVQKLRDAHAAATARGLTVRLAVFDTIVSIPGLLLPWRRLAAACRELGMLSLVDGAHGIGHIDLTDLGSAAARPDFFVSNCHKWLFVPRGCAMLYVPFRNQHYMETSLPTSMGFQPVAALRDVVGATGQPAYFASQFAEVATMDYTPWMCIPAAVKWRQQVCGGEEAIRAYCFGLARKGSDRVAAILGTDVMGSTGSTSSMRECAMNNVRLPFAVVADDKVAAGGDPAAVPVLQFAALHNWAAVYAADKYDTYFRIFYYGGQPWVRLSAQVYLDEEDFEWAGQTLLALCDEIKKGAWKA